MDTRRWGTNRPEIDWGEHAEAVPLARSIDRTVGSKSPALVLSIACGALLALLVIWLSASSAEAMSLCQQSHSLDTCHSVLIR